MAKSIRSKWKRKCRAVKRERYGKKELDRLKKTLGIADGEPSASNMKDISEVVTFTTVDEVKQKSKEKTDEAHMDIMDLGEVDEIKKKFNPKTLRNENGAYPVWVHPRKVKKCKRSKNKKSKSKGKVSKTTK